MLSAFRLPSTTAPGPTTASESSASTGPGLAIITDTSASTRELCFICVLFRATMVSDGQPAPVTQPSTMVRGLVCTAAVGCDSAGFCAVSSDPQADRPRAAPSSRAASMAVGAEYFGVLVMAYLEATSFVPFFG